METLLAIIFIVFGILQIILFFKIWGMTNDVREMKKNQQLEPKSIKARIAYLRGDKELAQRLMDEYFFEEARDFATSDIYDFKKNYTIHVESCSNLYANMGLKAPDFEKYKNEDLLVITRHKLMNEAS